MANPYPFLQTTSTASIAGVNPKLLTALNQIGQNMGQTITIISGYRAPGYSAKVGGYANDPHTRGEAVDAYINGKPLGDVVPLATLTRLGLQGGNQPGFYQGKTDPEHVQIPGSGVDKSMTSPDLKLATGVASTGNVPSTDPTTASTPNSSVAQMFVDAVSKQTGVSPKVLDFWINQEGAYASNGTGGFNFLNLRPEQGDPYASVSPGKFERFSNVNDAITATVRRLKEPFMSTLMQTVKSGGDPAAQWKAIMGTGWDAGHYAGTSFNPNTTLPNVPGGGTQASTGATGATGALSNQFTKATPPYNPAGAIISMLRMASQGGPTYKPVNLNVANAPTLTPGLPLTNFAPFGIAGPFSQPTT